ncbi:MFS transporter [Novosphingobium sp. YJ-S2-02]|uniref:MFS transporter n=1 Tax=Novosphingobium aureum TaxID=2792964 RepID=A0A931HAW5_9SPHN|nr:MFS transporter [Novosphingobium aureum]MBH0112591.1 MFS transporter [Novosphingobium aureum]
MTYGNMAREAHDPANALEETPDESRARGEFASGWMLILACALGVGVGLTGLVFYSFGIFLKPLSSEFGWSRSAISSGMMCVSVGTVVIGPFLGMAIDRIGVRVLATLSLAGLAIGFFAMTRIGPDIESFYLTLILLAVLGSATTPLTWTRAVSVHFTQRRGLALGLMLLGTGMASAVAPPLLQSVIASSGWRMAYAAIGMFVLVACVPAAWFGLARADRAGRIAARTGTGLTQRETLRTRRFWTIVVSLLIVTIAQAGAMVHMPASLSDQGLDEATVGSALAAMGISVVLGRLAVGYLIDIVHAPFVAAAFFAMPVLSMWLFAHDLSPALAILAAALLGLAGGAEVDLLSFFIGRHFGMRAYGANYGLALTFFGIGAGGGPALTGSIFDITGSYAPAYFAGMAMFALGAVLIATLGRSRY